MFAITGASGFIGRAVVSEAARRGLRYCIIGRNQPVPGGVQMILHIAGLAHSRADEAAFMAANFHRTVALFQSAREQGVKRFIFLSSVAAAAPANAYGRSKRRAESELLALAGDAEVVVVRPPLVYSAEAPASFGLLNRLSRTPLLLPFASIRNRRSLVGRTNLVDALLYLVLAPSVPSDIYTVTDGQPVSLSEIVTAVRSANGAAPGLFPVDVGLLRAALSMLGRAAMASQLFDDLVFEDDKLRNLGWVPPLPPLAAAELVVSAQDAKQSRRREA